jgi:hypothetical protein
MNKALSAYQRSQRDTPSADFERLKATYEAAVLAAIHKDTQQAKKSLALLEAMIHPDTRPEIALSLQAIYADCSELLENEDWANFAESMEKLKGLWIARSRLDRAMLPE